ncbi:MAG: hypothetical protein ACAI44_35035 [Candidatus Sericytochromatia bacterium]
MELKGSFTSHQEAIQAANKLKGNEAIKKEADGSFGVYSLTAEEKKAVDKHDFSQFTEDVLTFTLDRVKGADKVVDRFSSTEYKTVDAARTAAEAHPGHEALVRNDNGTISLFPFVEEDKAKAAESGSFSKFANDTIAVSLDKPGADTLFEAVDARSKKLAQLADELMDNVHANQAKLTKKSKDKPNKYTLGAESVDVAAGRVEADCSGFIKAMHQKVGVEFGPRSAEEIGRLVRSGKGPFKPVKHGADIRPGDILSFSLPERTEITGHIMMAAGEPEPILKNGKLVGYHLRIIDSTSKAHGDDSDHGNGKSGAGNGIITVGVDRNDRINTLSWKDNFGGYTYRHEVTVGRIK